MFRFRLCDAYYVEWHFDDAEVRADFDALFARVGKDVKLQVEADDTFLQRLGFKPGISVQPGTRAVLVLPCSIHYADDTVEENVRSHFIVRETAPLECAQREALAQRLADLVLSGWKP